MTNENMSELERAKLKAEAHKQLVEFAEQIEGHEHENVAAFDFSYRTSGDIKLRIQSMEKSGAASYVKHVIDWELWNRETPRILVITVNANTFTKSFDSIEEAKEEVLERLESDTQ